MNSSQACSYEYDRFCFSTDDPDVQASCWTFAIESCPSEELEEEDGSGVGGSYEPDCYGWDCEPIDPTGGGGGSYDPDDPNEDPTDTECPGEDEGEDHGQDEGNLTLDSTCSDEEEEEDSAREIILNPSFIENPCLSSVYEQAGEAAAFQNILKNFDGEFSVAHLQLAGNSSLPQETNARTYTPENWVIKIDFNTNKLNRPPLDIARTLIHELIHAEMYRKLLSLANKGEIQWSTNFLDSMRNDFPGLYDYYMRWHFEKPDGISSESPQHQMMAEHYRGVIVEALTAYDNSYNDEVYEALAWRGLHNTVSWNNLSNEEKYSIREKRDLFNLNNPPCQ